MLASLIPARTVSVPVAWWSRTSTKGFGGCQAMRTSSFRGALTITKGEAALELLGHFGHEILYETETERSGQDALPSSRGSLG